MSKKKQPDSPAPQSRIPTAKQPNKNDFTIKHPESIRRIESHIIDFSEPDCHKNIEVSSLPEDLPKRPTGGKKE